MAGLQFILMRGEIIVIERRVNDGVAVILKVGRFDAAWDRLPTVKKEDGHGGTW